MKEILSDTLTIPGVIGGFFYHRDRGVLAVELPTVFKPDKLEQMARMLLKIFSSGLTNLNGVAEVSICYEETILVARALDENSYLILLCETNVNLELLGMSLNLSLEETLGRVNQQILVDDSPAESPPPVNSLSIMNEQPTLIDNQEDLSAVNSAPLDEVLQGMQNCLAKVIGPIAKIVFQDAVHQWKQYASTDASDFPMLMNMVLSHIDDPDHKRKFQELITDYIEKRL
ncbi:uncharacterized protein Dvar_73990 [Desulfosarcina variabilis str. Montpellier]|uniref:hypothetical protein n=1 Tax=Desulfosarcina variabilis TaxID=2300 RepID=UPI003AFB6ACE